MTAINNSIRGTDEIDGNYVQIFVINIYSAFRSFFVKLLLHKLSLFLKYILIFFLNHINSYTATHTKTNVPVPNSVSLSTKVDVHVS